MSESRPLRVLVAHNAYQHRGGEDSVVEAETALLRSRGHEVELYRRDNHDLAAMGRIDAALQTLHSRRTLAEVGALMARFRPDILHVHNTVPLISPSVYWAAHRAGVPVVQTLHNFRLLCPQALLLREGRVCEDCVGRVPWRGVVHGCYRDSRAQTAVIALANTAHRVAGTWRDKIDRYIALNEFARRKYVEGGLPADRVVVKPNFVELSAPQDGPRDGLLYVGRLSAEKGITTLLAAADVLPEGVRVRVVGSGPLEALVREHPRIDYLGALAPEAVYGQMRRSALLLVPSICYDNFPRTIVEAFACGLPVLASDLGALPELIEPSGGGLLAPAGDAAQWARQITRALERGDDLLGLGRAARRHFEAVWTADANYRTLVDIYSDASKSSSIRPREQ